MLSLALEGIIVCDSVTPLTCFFTFYFHMKSDIWKHCGETMKSKVRILKSGGRYVYSNSERMSLLRWRSVREINYKKVSGGDCCWSYQSGADAAAVFESVQAVCVASLHKERTILPPTQPTSATIVTHWGLLDNIFCSILNPGIYAWALSAWSVCHLSPSRGYLLHLTHLCLCSESGAFTPEPERCLCTYRVWNLFRLS